MGFVNNNVVSLYGNIGTKTTLTSAQVANLTAAVKSIATMHLTMLLRTMFSELDDTLFVISDNTVYSNKKTYCYDDIHELRLINKQIEILFIKRFVELFSQSLLLSPQLSLIRAKESLCLNSLQNCLEINEIEFEASIMLTHFIAKANKIFEDKIENMQTGFNYLMKDMLAGVRGIPVAPALIAVAFRLSMESLDGKTVQRTIIYDHFDQGVMQKLGEMYDQINALFIKVGAI